MAIFIIVNNLGSKCPNMLFWAFFTFFLYKPSVKREQCKPFVCYPLPPPSQKSKTRFFWPSRMYLWILDQNIFGAPPLDLFGIKLEERLQIEILVLETVVGSTKCKIQFVKNVKSKLRRVVMHFYVAIQKIWKINKL